MIESYFDDLRRAKGLREGRDLSVRAVALETGLSYNTLQRIRNRPVQRVYVGTLDVLCRYFQLKSIAQLIEYRPEPPAESADAGA